MKNVSDEYCRENQNTRFVFNNLFIFRKSYRNMDKCCRAGQATDDDMAHAIACWVTNATNAQTVCVIFIAFPLQQ
jgi:hypothetical protein